MLKEGMHVEYDFLKLSDELGHMTVSHVWEGYHGTVFFELGELTKNIRSDGTEGNPRGEISICFQWCWMLFKGDELICESEVEEDVRLPILKTFVGQSISVLKLDEALEIGLYFENEFAISSMADDGKNPDWFIIDNRIDKNFGFEVKEGKLSY